MKFTEKLLVSLHPPLLIPQKWNSLWEEENRKGFKVTATIYCMFWAVTYLLHFYLVDIPLKKEPLSDWAFYRFSCAAVMAVAFLISMYKRCYNSKWRKVPIALAGLYICYMQATSMVWREQIPYFYITILPVLTTLTLSSSIAFSLFYLVVGYFVTLHGMLARPDLISYILSSHLAGIVVVAVVRSAYTNKVKAFLGHQESIEANKKIIELQTEIQEQVKSFLPKVIYTEFKDKIENGKLSAKDAFEEVTELKETKAAILYSDIRGFTKESRIDKAYLKEKVIPNLKVSAQIVERNYGVPRQIGDLIFAYFAKSNERNILKQVVRCAFQLIDSTQDSEGNFTVKRHAIISYGDVLVGNVGGDDFSKEITVHGDPANIGSRIDTLTKHPNFLKHFQKSVIIFTPEIKEKLAAAFPKLAVHTYKFDADFKLRDFEEISELLVVEFNTNNMYTVFEELTNNKHEQQDKKLKLVA